MTTAIAEARLLEACAGLGSAAVAFSGGTDSALVLAACVRALGAERVVAATAQSSSLATGEVEHAAGVAAGARGAARGGAHRRDGRRGVPGERRRPLLLLQGHPARHPAPARRPARPGRAWPPGPTPTTPAPASAPASAPPPSGAPAPRCATPGSPRPRCGRSRAAWGLPTWDRPAAACLSSRVAYGVAITPARLARVDRAEADLRAALVGCRAASRDLRVRDLGDVASVEVDAALVPLLAGAPRPARGRAGLRRGPGGPARLPVRAR